MVQLRRTHKKEPIVQTEGHRGYVPHAPVRVVILRSAARLYRRHWPLCRQGCTAVLETTVHRLLYLFSLLMYQHVSRRILRVGPSVTLGETGQDGSNCVLWRRTAPSECRLSTLCGCVPRRGRSAPVGPRAHRISGTPCSAGLDAQQTPVGGRRVERYIISALLCADTRHGWVLRVRRVCPYRFLTYARASHDRCPANSRPRWVMHKLQRSSTPPTESSDQTRATMSVAHADALTERFLRCFAAQFRQSCQEYQRRTTG